MHYFGPGLCDDGYFVSLAEKGVEYQEKCNAICLSDLQCTNETWNPDQTCFSNDGRTCRIEIYKGATKFDITFKQLQKGSFSSLEFWISSTFVYYLN